MDLREFEAVFTGENSEMFKSLGINSSSDTYFDKVTIDLDRVESFFPVRKDADSEKNQTNIVMASGDMFTVSMKYEDFKKLY